MRGWEWKLDELVLDEGTQEQRRKGAQHFLTAACTVLLLLAVLDAIPLLVHLACFSRVGARNVSSEKYARLSGDVVASHARREGKTREKGAQVLAQKSTDKAD